MIGRIPGVAVAMVLAGSTPGSAQQPTPAIVSTEWIAARSRDRNVVLVEVAMDSARYSQGHIPGARLLSHMDYVTTRGDVKVELPPADELARSFAELGISDESHVVLYGNPLMVSRVYFTLAWLGLPRVSVLDGGRTRWVSENRTLETGIPAWKPGRITPRPQAQMLATAEWIMASRMAPGITLLDTRTEDEFLGTGSRRGLPSKGRIAGSVRLEWEDLVRDDEEDLWLVSMDSLRALYRARVPDGNSIVTYCLVGMRASLSYLVARHLGYDARMYDGSYDEWAARGLPLVAGAPR